MIRRSIDPEDDRAITRFAKEDPRHDASSAKACQSIQARLSEYMDGAVSGVEMRHIADHLSCCKPCAAEFALAARLQHTLVTLGTVKAPTDLALKLRIAISQERARGWRSSIEQLNLSWQNAIRPFVLQASAGLACAVLLLGSILSLLGAMGAGTPVMANDEPLGAMTAPHYLYSIDGVRPVITPHDETIVIEAAIDARGEVYDFRIVSGAQDPAVRDAVVQRLASSVFQPASVFGLPVRGHVVITFSGVSVQA